MTTDDRLIKKEIFTAKNLFHMKAERREKIQSTLENMQGMVSEWHNANKERTEKEMSPRPGWEKEHPFRNAHVTIRGLCTLDSNWEPPDENPNGWVNDEVCFFFFWDRHVIHLSSGGRIWNDLVPGRGGFKGETSTLHEQFCVPQA